MKRSDEDIDHLLRDWDRLASTARQPSAGLRRRATATKATLPVSLVVIATLAVVGVALLGRAPAGPADASPATIPEASSSGVTGIVTGPVVGTTGDGQFRLILTTDRGAYREGDRIDAVATVEFLGPESSIEVGHASQPVVFGVRDVGGQRQISGVTRSVLKATRYQRSEVVRYPWAKSGAPDGDPVNDAFLAQYLAGPEDDLRLPAGTWTLSVTFAERLTASVVVTVARPGDTAALAEAPTESRVADDRFVLTLKTDHSTYAEGDPIDAGATIEFLGPEDEVVVGYGKGLPVFAVSEVGGLERATGPVPWRLMCGSTTLARGEALDVPWVKAGSYANDNPTQGDAFMKAYLAGPELRLPAGRWRLTVSFDAGEGRGSTDACVVAPRHSLSASVEVTVLPSTSAAGPTPATTTGPSAPAFALGPIVRCVGVDPGDCEGAIALVRDREPAAYGQAAIIVVTDLHLCPDGMVCDMVAPHVSVALAAADPAGARRAYRVMGSSVTWTGTPDTSDPEVATGFEGAVDMFRLLTATPRLPGEERSCMAAIVSGTLVVAEETGIGLAANGTLTRVTWPFGYSGRRNADGVALVDRTGQVVGRLGDRFEGGGGYGEDDRTATVCE